VAESDYVGNPATFATPKTNTNGSGSSTFWANSFEKLVDRTAWLKARNDALFGATGATVTRAVTIPALPVSGTWALQATGTYVTSVNTACVLRLEIPACDLPHGVTLTSAFVSVLPANHGSLVGLTLPKLELYSFDTIAGITQVGATINDPSLNIGSYNVQHAITVASISTLVDRTTKRYFMLFTSEVTGANAASGLLVVGGGVTYTAT
jgi:hypothetical protein